ncbi:SLBB domain-containing protein [Thermaurantiacus sp.]
MNDWSLKRLRELATAVLLAATMGANAQAIDPRILESVQQTLNAREAARAAAEAARTDTADRDNQPIVPPGGKVDTPEEQEVRRVQARRELETLYIPSPVEADWRRRLGDPTIRLFGYDFFQAAPAPTGVRAGAVGDDYILGIGDEIAIAFRGATNENRTARVDRDGRILVGQLPPIQAAGRSLGAVKALIAAETRRTMLATDVYVSVDNVRSISVFVGGEVVRPGQFSLTSLADVATAIAQAGGVRRTGSLRQVRVVRSSGATQIIDLYGFLGIGAPSNVRLMDGDRILVPVIGPTVAVTGAVARPAIYELRGAASLDQVVAFAGGPVRQRGAEVVISRIGPDGLESFLKPPARTAPIIGGDAVVVLGGSPGGSAGRVALFGHVDNPGPRPLAAAGTIGQLVGPVESLRPDTYQSFAVLLRVDPSTGSRMLVPINLAAEIRGRSSTILRNQDQLFLLSRADIQFINGVAVRSVVLGQPNPLPQCQSLNRLAAIVRDTQSDRFTAATRGSLVIREGASDVLAATGRAATINVRATAALRSLQPEQEICPSVFELEPDLLPFVIEQAVSVGGSVRRPGAYPVAGEASARDLAALAEGFIPGTTDLTLDLNRGGATRIERIPVGSDDLALDAVRVRPGDDLRFSGTQPAFEGSGVLVAGEVVRPGLYAIRKGEKLSELLARAGGLTEYAYPYGAIFTRQRVKEAEQEGYRRTARELNNSLLAATARSGDRGTEGLQGAAALIQLIASAEATGRVVVEADPRVLAIRPDLDTVLEAGDSISIPKRPNYVLALGDVLNPGALQFVNGKDARGYLRDAGGTMATADEGRIYLVLPNGTAQPIRSGAWASRARVTPPPGSTIVVPKNIDPLYRLSVFRDVTTIISQLAISAATIGVLARN